MRFSLEVSWAFCVQNHLCSRTAAERSIMIFNNYNPNDPVVIAVDHGYGNIKTSHFCFRSGVTVHDKEPVIKNDMLIYNGRY